ncbi:hypothetical protein M9H77_30898 [Catharanthus roseus]|uniref:Uncharacterized protein n=1 Tax=Catharanthus roseus TaxID=4058 RepID=A0ACB9ZYY0_CATRO|nr:hypothetical protein M9H77_30898 [Catharanthus roseus]
MLKRLVGAKAACGCHVLGWGLDWFESTLGKYFPSVYDFRDSGMLFIAGRRLLRPLHEWAMSVLKRIPMDATFNQRASLRRLVGDMHCYSYDLSAATDRWPLRIIFTTVMYLSDRSFASTTLALFPALTLTATPNNARQRGTLVGKEEKETPTDSGNAIKIERENRPGLEDCPTTSVLIEGEVVS